MLKKLQRITQPFLEKVQPSAEKSYVILLMDVIAHGLVSASHNDADFRKEVAGFRIGQTIQMKVMPNIAQFTVQVTEDARFRIIPESELVDSEKVDLAIKFKHVSLAFLVLSFQESTTTAFARDRMVADGDISDAIRMVRCLNRLEVLILPKIVAKLAVKEYPNDLTLKEKLQQGSKVYAGVAKSFLVK